MNPLRLGRYFLPSAAARHPSAATIAAISFRDDDHARYRDWLADAAAAYRCAIHAYVLMIDHAHLLVTADEECLPRAMQSLGRLYRRRLRADGNAVGRSLPRGTHR